MMKLLNYIKPNLKVARSINLERDQNNQSVTSDYHVTNKTVQIVNRFADALLGERVSAWSMTGPYGMGKSAFVNFLLTITKGFKEARAEEALQKIKESDTVAYQRFVSGLDKVAGERGFFNIYVTASYESINHSIARGLEHALTDPEYKTIKRDLHKLQSEKVIETQALLALIKTVKAEVAMPFVVVIDEFGKCLEYMSHNPLSGDVYIMQQLAELDSTYLWVCLHQAFDEYSSGLSGLRKQEWSKIQGRFEDISFIESDEQMIYFMERSLTKNYTKELDEKINKWAESARDFLSNLNISEDIKGLFTIDTIKNLYPLHPISALMLIQLCRRFAQNDRTLLAFMCSGDRYALPAYLERSEITDRLPTVGLDYLYDYFFNINMTMNSHAPEAQKWIQIQDIINNIVNRSAVDEAILKHIGILNLVGGFVGIKAQQELLCTVVENAWGTADQEVQHRLEDLNAIGILHYREYANEYRLWEGTDYDIQGALRAKRSQLIIRDLDALLEQFLPFTPLIAARHAQITGTIRRFERRWIELDKITSDICPGLGFDGLLLYCFSANALPADLPNCCSDGRPLIINFSRNKVVLHQYALEVAATRSLLDESPELVNDIVARREMKHRVRIAEEAFRQYLTRHYLPNNGELTWYAAGQSMTIRSSRELSNELSKLCDRTYYASPIIRNEMISYDAISSSAAAARRALIEAMVTHQDQNLLGLSGFGPEVAVYRSLLRAPGLHVEDEASGQWRFSLETADEQMTGLWEKLEELIRSAKSGITVAAILEELQKPPFGMRLGPAPIYVSLFILSKADDIAVFQEGSYKPYLSPSTMSLLIKRPELFTLRKFVENGINQQLFKIYHQVLSTSLITENDGLRNASAIGVIGPMLKLINELTPYAKRTRDVSPEAIKLRFTLENTTDPIGLLFNEIPKALNIDVQEKRSGSNWEDVLHQKLFETLQELRFAIHKLEEKVIDSLKISFQEQNIDALYQNQRERAQRLIPISEEADLKALLQAFARKYENPLDWVKGIAGLITKKPLGSWDDSDFIPFEAKLKDYALRIGLLESLLEEDRGGDGLKAVSFMSAGGKLVKVIPPRQREQVQVKEKVGEILKLPKEQVAAILLALANHIQE